MRFATLTFLFGILVGQTINRLPDIHWSIGLLLLLGWLRWPRLQWLFFFLLGLFWVVWRANVILSQELLPVLENQEVVVIGKIINLPLRTEKGWRFEFNPATLTFQGKNWPLPGRLRLTWFMNKRSVLPQLASNQTWRLTVRLKRARSSLNPGGFDHSQWLFQQRIRAVGHVRDRTDCRLLSPPTWSIDGLRAQLIQAMQAALEKRESTGLLIALAVGSNQGISQSQREVLQKTGIMHLIVISGSHISLIAALVFWLARWAWSFIGATWLLPTRFAALLSIGAATFYTLLAGFSIPTQRALIMVTVVLFSNLFPRNVAPSHILSLALGSVLIYDPLAVLNVGFWLSFGIVVALVYSESGRRSLYVSSLEKWGFRLLKAQFVATLTALPILLSIFNYVSLTTFFANAIAIPWISFIIVPLNLLGAGLTLFSPILGGFLLNFTADITEALWVSMVWLADLPHSVWYFPVPPFWTLFPALVGIVILLLPRGFPGRWSGMIWLLPLFLLPVPTPKLGEAWFTLLDVGQGLAAVIRTQNHTLVYDTGPLFSGDFDMGQAVVIPFLQSQGLSTIDTLIISHSHTDHSGGARSLVKNLAVKKILTSQVSKLASLLPPATPISACRAGQQWQWNGTEFSFKFCTQPPIF